MERFIVLVTGGDKSTMGVEIIAQLSNMGIALEVVDRRSDKAFDLAFKARESYDGHADHGFPRLHVAEKENDATRVIWSRTRPDHRQTFRASQLVLKRLGATMAPLATPREIRYIGG